MASPFLVSLFAHKAWSNARLAESLRTLPADVDVVARAVILLTFEHTHLVDRAFQARLEDRAPDIGAVVGRAVPDIDVLSAAMAELDAWYVRYASDVSDVELGRIVEFTYLIDGESGRMTKADMLGHVVTHGASHRGQIGKMLSDLKIKGASDMMTTFRRPAADRA
jgi:uncharacterized damage-inducible protein DinB